MCLDLCLAVPLSLLSPWTIHIDHLFFLSSFKKHQRGKKYECIIATIIIVPILQSDLIVVIMSSTDSADPKVAGLHPFVINKSNGHPILTKNSFAKIMVTLF